MRYQARRLWMPVASSSRVSGGNEMNGLRHRTIDETIQIAVTLHSGQRDKAGVPYIAHPLAVMRRLPEEAWHVAVLHDAIEDGGLTEKKLRRLMYTDEEIEAITLLSRRKDESYEAFIDSIAHSGNRLAIRVKIADLEDNLDPSRPQQESKLRNRYILARKRLNALLA
jgi:GTP diphosphokinase / guanosine-3',5'-bis(diphosphate) 3'-diphosphatase